MHDYLQLVFEAHRISIFNRSTLEVAGRQLHTGESGFADGLVQLIGQRVLHASVDPTLMLHFERGCKLVVLTGANDANGPEAFEYCEDGGGLVVAQNAA